MLWTISMGWIYQYVKLYQKLNSNFDERLPFFQCFQFKYSCSNSKIPEITRFSSLKSHFEGKFIKINYSQKDVHRAFLSWWIYIRLTHYHQIWVELWMYFVDPSFVRFKWCENVMQTKPINVIFIEKKDRA